MIFHLNANKHHFFSDGRKEWGGGCKSGRWAAMKVSVRVKDFTQQLDIKLTLVLGGRRNAVKKSESLVFLTLLK